MKNLGRLAVLLVPLVVGLVSLALPGRAQTPDLGRYAFADTLLLRDTLGVHFAGLFPLADSMQTSPDTLRALAMRYRAPLWRIVRMADSLAVPVDSISAVMERARFNPLAANLGESNSFTYNSSYAIQQTSGDWKNTSQWNRTSRRYVITQSTTVDLTRYTGATLTLQQNRNSTTDASYRFSPDLSAGANVQLDRSDYTSPGGVSSVATTTNAAKFALHMRGRPMKDLNTELDLLPGLLDDRRTESLKRAASVDLRSRVRYSKGNVFTNDLTARLTGNLGRTRLPNAVDAFSTRDFSPNVTGTMSLFNASALGANLNYRYQRSQTQLPIVGGIQSLVNQNNAADLTVRARLDNDRQLSVVGRYGNNRAAQSNPLGSAAPSSFTTSRNLELEIDGRYHLLGIDFDGQFNNSLTISEFPLRGPNGGYGDSTHLAKIQVHAIHRAGPRITISAGASVDLTRDRVYLIGQYPTPPVNRDAYNQDYNIKLNYAVSEDFSSNVAVDVRRALALNLDKSSAGSNLETRAYDARWFWSYRLFPDLTAQQSNGITATYQYYTYRPQSSRLNLFYSNTTTLNAILSKAFTLNLSHSVNYQPAGNYTPQPDGFYAFSLADQQYTYSLKSDFSYQPSTELRFTITSSYVATKSNTISAGALAPSRRDKSLTLSPSAHLELPIGQRGRLTGDMGRNNTSNSSTTWSQGLPQTILGRPQGYWSGQLGLTWTL